MAKVTKTQLKGIVKECLIEILSEGIGGGSISAFTSTTSYNINESTAKSSRSRTPTPNRPSLDNVSFSRQEDAQHAVAMKEDISTLTSDPIMQSIFADTHVTTVMSQTESGASNMSEAVALQGDQAARAMAQNDPMDVFGEASDKWAALAFSSGKNS